MEWWNAAVTEDADNGWFPHDEALQRLVLDKKADIGDLFPAVASEVTYASKGARGSPRRHGHRLDIWSSQRPEDGTRVYQ